MMRSRVDLPEPFRPRTPILAPGKKDREMFLRICFFGGTILPTRSSVEMHWDIGIQRGDGRKAESAEGKGKACAGKGGGKRIHGGKEHFSRAKWPAVSYNGGSPKSPGPEKALSCLAKTTPSLHLTRISRPP